MDVIGDQNLLSTVVGQIKNSSMTYGFLMYKPEDGKVGMGRRSPIRPKVESWGCSNKRNSDPQLYMGRLDRSFNHWQKTVWYIHERHAALQFNNQSWKNCLFRKAEGRCDTPLAYRRNSGNTFSVVAMICGRLNE